MARPLADGDEILAGRLFRRIPNYKNRFDVRTGRPLIGAFRTRATDARELSAHLEGFVSQERIFAVMLNHSMLRPFGLCALDVATIRFRTEGRIRVIYRPDSDDPQLGHAHVVLTNCGDEIQHILAGLAQFITAPAT